MVDHCLPPQKAGIVVLRNDEKLWHCLLLRAYRYWGFPKGVIEPGETPLAAAKREVWEETSLTELDFRWGDTFIELPPARRHKVVRYYVAVALDAQVHLQANAELGRPEHQEFRWTTFLNGNALLEIRLQSVLTWAESICRSRSSC